uniref:Uncharacterized protein n=1 Tax=Cacopsylla melanoneura TaxID=428564 RepID=A0A8D8X5C7_9HEMI
MSFLHIFSFSSQIPSTNIEFLNIEPPTLKRELEFFITFPPHLERRLLNPKGQNLNRSGHILCPKSQQQNQFPWKIIGGIFPKDTNNKNIKEKRIEHEPSTDNNGEKNR